MKALNNLICLVGLVFAFAWFAFEESHDPAWIACALILVSLMKGKIDD